MKKIIFDLDSTLLFLSPEWTAVYQQFIDKYNLKITPIQLFGTIGEIEQTFRDILIDREFVQRFVNNELSLNLTTEQLEELYGSYANIPLLNVDIVSDTLNYLSQKYELIAYSNWFTDNQVARLRKNNLERFFSKMYGWDVLPIKPSENGLKEIIKDDNLADYIFVGDNIKTDIEPPTNMGIQTIFYNRKNIKQDKYVEIQRIDELKNIL